MSDQHQERPTRLGAFDKASSPRMTAVEIIAGALSLMWLIGVAVAFLGLGVANPGPDAQPIDFVMLMLAVFMPIALIWVAAAVAKTARVMREEAMRLQAAISAMRLAYLQQSQPGPSGAKPGIEKKLDELAQAQRQTEAAVVQFTSRRDGHASEKKPALAKDASSVVAVHDGQPALALGTPNEVPSEPISVADFISAANFPETAEDKDGFRALRLALEDREASKLIRSAQDVLTLLSQDGIYMDDLRPDRTKPDLWRRFAAGERAGPIAALGGIRDRSCLALTSARMRSDPVFRDTAHHYLRQFDRTLIWFEQTASDSELAQFADTRSARAFMLLGRVTGMFD
ncbi:MAG: hypothetical protein ACI9KS_000709 [Sulfitobacter sp.]|jgi:hypothetical protein